MGFFKDLTSNPLNLVVGGPILGGAANINKASNERKNARAASALDIYNNSLASEAKDIAGQKKNQYYGNTLENLGKQNEKYSSLVEANVGKNVADADLYNQQFNQQRGVDQTRAGLSGVDSTAMNEQARRTASMTAAGINEKAKRESLDIFGNSIGNKITGANQIDNSEQALAIAQMKSPTTNANPGLIGSIFGGFLG
jgi:hypothetical protein